MSNERENRWPTPREFVDDWEEATDNQRLARAERVLQDAQAAHMCFVKNHDGLQGEVEFLWSKVARVEALVAQWIDEADQLALTDLPPFDHTLNLCAKSSLYDHADDLRAALDGGS